MFTLYRIPYLFDYINRPGRLLNIWTLRVGGYSRWALIRGWALIKFSSFSASVVCLFCTKTINGNNKTRRCNKARFLLASRRRPLGFQTNEPQRTSAGSRKTLMMTLAQEGDSDDHLCIGGQKPYYSVQYCTHPEDHNQTS